jgi:hypothetical protein
MGDQLIVTLNVVELKKILNESIADALSNLSTNSEEEKLLSRKDVAKFFRISLVTLNNWMRQNKIPYHKINSRIYFKHSEILEALKTIQKYGRK